MEFRSCTQPWFEMQLMYNRVSRFCCYHYDVGFDDNLDIPTIWNSDLFTKTRSEIAGGDPTGTRCDVCSYIKYVDKPLFLDIPEHVTGARRENWQRALEHFENGDAVIESLPVKYYVQFGLACNLRCIMCDHPTRFKAGENQTFDPNILFERSDYLRLATSIHVIGGEPFLIPSAVRFIETAAQKQELWDLEYNFYTNGFLLDRFIEKLGNFERVVATISLDSFGERYEYIRRRASWKRLDQNVQAFRTFARDKGYPWRVHIACVLMKSGIPGLPDLAKWCTDNDAMIHFAPVFDHTDAAKDEENVFGNPGLLREIPGWERNLQDAIDIFRQAGWVGSAAQLGNLHRELSEKAQGWEATTARKNSEMQRLHAINYHRCLFETADKPVLDNLYKHIYDSSDVGSAFSSIDDKTVFRPSGPKDHLSTPFFEVVAQGSERPQYIRIAGNWPAADKSGKRANLVLQDQQCTPLRAFAGGDKAANGEFETYFQLESGVDSVRLVIYGDMKPGSVLPNSLRIETC
jgi:hypothetical protein